MAVELNALLSCPFCGRKANLVSVDDGRFYTVSSKHKKKCYMYEGDALYYYSVDKQKLIDEWNARAT